jgi:hypothetical protein
MTSFHGAGVWSTGRSRLRVVPAAMLLLLGACNGLGEAMTAHTNVVARAAGKELRVDEAAQMLAANPQVPPDPEVVRALADLWVDYTLLASAVAEDTTLAAVDLAPFIDPIRDQALIARLRERVVQPDTVITDEELGRRWVTEGASAEISARHILLRVAPDATQAQRDSVAQLAETLRTRAVGGESFDALARQYSDDPGSAARGGDLGFFSRGRMVEPFEEAAFALQAGEISPVVETPFGLHIILVDERRQPELGDQREAFRQFLVQRAVQDAEVAYLDQLTEGSNLQVNPAGFDVVREIAARPDRGLRGRQADRSIATYTGGEYTAGEFAEFIRNQPQQVQSAFATATNDQLEQGVRQLVQMELLLERARSEGIALSEAEEAEIRAEARASIRELVEATGFAEAARVRADAAALEAHVKALISGVVTGEQPYIPLGMLGIALRDRYPYEINDGSFSQVVSRLEEIRGEQPMIQMPGLNLEGMPGMPPMPDMPEQAPPVTPLPEGQ